MLLQQRLTRIYTPQNWANCPIPTTITLNVTAEKKTIENKITLTGQAFVADTLEGELGLTLGVNRCSLDMKKCEKYSNRNFKDMCRRFQETNSFYSSFFKSIKPEWKCPIKAGNYTFSQGSIELAPIALFPMDNYVWIVSFRLIGIDPVSKAKKILMCLNTETKIVKVNKSKQREELWLVGAISGEGTFLADMVLDKNLVVQAIKL